MSINDEGTYIAVGDDNSSLFYRNGGAVYVYSLVNSAWEIYGPIIPPVAGKVLAGKKVSISDLGSRVMVQHRDSLAVYAYNGSSSYSMVGSPISISPNDSCSFSKDGDHILIGNPNSGVVRSYEYVLSNLDFSLVGDPIESDPIILFGKSTSISKDGSSIAVSAPLYNSVLSVENVGGAAVYKYEK